MLITATASGGYAGVQEQYRVDTATSAAGPALEAAIAASGFFAAPAMLEPAALGADLRRWTITVDADGQRHSVSFTEGGNGVSGSWQALLERIRAAA